jgi:hypothetical protein
MLSPSLVLCARSVSLVIALLDIPGNSAFSQVGISKATASGEGVGRSRVDRRRSLRQSPFARPALGASAVLSPALINHFAVGRPAR